MSEHSILELLRQHTLNLHRRLDRHPVFTSVLHAPVTEDVSRLALSVLFQWHSWSEQAIAPIANDAVFKAHGIVPQWEPTLSLCHSNLPSPDVSCKHIDTPAKAVGVLYVMLGASNGADYLQKRLSKHSSSDELVHYYRSQSKNLVYWQKFKVVLPTWVRDTGASQKDILAGAKAAFCMIIEAADNASAAEPAGVLYG